MKLLAKGIGGILMFLAFLQWITFDYPDVNPFWPGAIFSPGVVSQFLNWILVCTLGASGWLLFSYGSGKSAAQGPAVAHEDPKRIDHNQ